MFSINYLASELTGTGYLKLPFSIEACKSDKSLPLKGTVP